MSSPVDISPNHMDMILDILRKYLPVGVKVWVFGSRADWTTRDSSDLDLALEGDSALDYGVMVALETAFEESVIPYKVDVIDLNQVTDSFRRIVEVRRILLPLNEVQASGDGQWKQTTVEEFSPFTYGKSLPVHARNTIGQIPVFGPDGIIGYHDSALTDGPTVIIGRKGTVGSVHYSDVPCWPIDTTFFFTDQDVELVKFKYYALGTLSLDNMNIDSAVPSLNHSAVHAQKLRVPGEREQRRIVHILRTLDDKIELNRRMNQTLEEMARTLFKSWFVDFDPVRAKMDGRWKRRESLLGLPAEYYDMFPDHLVDSDLGDVPKGWKTKALVDCYKLTMGQSPPSNTYNESGDGVPFFQDRTDFGSRYPSNRKYCTAPTRFAQAGDTLVSVRAPVGDINLSWEQCCIGRGLSALRHNSGSISFTYYKLWTMQEQLRQYEHTGTVFGAINKKQFESLLVTEPAVKVVEAFDVYVLQLDSRIRLNEDACRTLIAQRDALLPKLMSGEIRVLKSAEGVA
ncbi:MAG: restriction endonuclease subunit S [Cenarchaeum sp. SB0661_bin_35]|nr:restriction endonuclease subunit S [Cenarchaeum sp. SB0667_bin_13]MYB46661.1 restriction endonuclease subunit S [Cenarchaeum sp. SB0662_bin_33]MYC79329.1 restriction endonuclease subunit S [Cenarchaeum sp. SB0661_bin_35]MYI52316.1 restriction endonuclease subunit S [Cenarchaeum sp. SB0673_bin_9]